MRNLTVATILLIFASFGTALGQDDDEIRKNEVYGGYTGHIFDDVIDYEYQQGFQGSYVRNVHRYLGLKGEFGSTWKKDLTVRNNLGTGPNQYSISTQTNRTITTLMGGVEIKDNKSKKSVRPFTHALVGVGWLDERSRPSCVSGNCPGTATQQFELTDTGFSTAYGGGVDIKVTKNLSLRPQADYTYIKLNGVNRHNLRFGAGLVFRWK